MLRIVLLCLSLTTGSVAAWIATQRPAPPSTYNVIAPSAVEHILVAGADMPRGHKIGREQLKWQPWPTEAISQGFISRSAQPDAIERHIGSITTTRLLAQEPITTAKLGAENGGVLARVLTPGRVAVGVRVNAETMAGGFVLPSDRVDVLHTSEEKSASDVKARYVTRSILRDIRVLAIDQAHDAASDDPGRLKPSVGKTATLELTREQAEVLASAQAKGSLSLALRSARDAPNGAVEESYRVVRVIRGGQTETVRIPVASGTGARAQAQEF